MKINRMIMTAAALLAAYPAVSNAALIRIGPGSFTPQASVITFSEQPLGTPNPVYSVNTATLGVVQVSFAGYFMGQTPTGGNPDSLSDTSPSGPLTLDAASLAFIVGDGSNPTSPVLSGTPTFNGPISVLFSTPVAAVGLDGGFFNGIAGTSIEAYDTLGNSLGIVSNNSTGIEFFGLADSSGASVIQGISFYITGNEPAGFAIDNLTFGARDQVSIIPEPGSLVGLGCVLATGLGFRSRRQRPLSA